MNKSELCARLSESASIPLDEASKVVEVFFGVIHDALMQEQRVEIRGFCSWKIKEYKSYAGRNPTTGETVLVPPKKLPFFKAGKDLLEAINKQLNEMRNTDVKYGEPMKIMLTDALVEKLGITGELIEQMDGIICFETEGAE